MALSIILLIILVLLSGFFSGSEAALLSVSTVTVLIYIKEKRRGTAVLAR